MVLELSQAMRLLKLNLWHLKESARYKSFTFVAECECVMEWCKMLWRWIYWMVCHSLRCAIPEFSNKIRTKFLSQRKKQHFIGQRRRSERKKWCTKYDIARGWVQNTGYITPFRSLCAYISTPVWFIVTFIVMIQANLFNAHNLVLLAGCQQTIRCTHIVRVCVCVTKERKLPSTSAPVSLFLSISGLCTRFLQFNLVYPANNTQWLCVCCRVTRHERSKQIDFAYP